MKRFACQPHSRDVRAVALTTALNKQSPFAQALQFLGLEGQSKWAFLGYESLFFCFFFGCAWAAVQFIRWDKR